MKQVISIAKQVREAVKDFAKKKATWQIDPKTLCGACAISSYILSNVLTRNGIKCELIVGRYGDLDSSDTNHCWVVVGDKIVDITASQFGKKDIYIVRKKHPMYYPIRQGSDAVWELRDDWDEQSPFHYQNDIERIESSI